MVIFAISGSLRQGSSNTSILHTLKSVAPAGVEFILYENVASLPHFNPDLDNENLPQEVKELRGMLNRSNAILISTPEYAHGIPGSLKNVLDWLVSTVLLENKPTGIILGSASEGNYARESLIEILKTMNAKVSSDLVMTLPGARTKNDDPNTWQELKSFIEGLVLATQPLS
ncbi:NADPH-dependent FMN reductase [Peredibacter starrii]|uniref:NADPH-dependent FMN reductase n=1 Tax=Peredibacter starrii TaxID=28202 RepID=A0AAX4HMM5_9BACT|nr:NADPH-dependent FMN reductase [Peredibacter starrii]WPU64534.1 NADPH-dependent FMN reductase [Peredibacter starrii]